MVLAHPFSCATNRAVRQRGDEAFRLRVTNTLHGAVEVSTDQGKTWHLVGRVSRAAETVLTDAAATLPAVLRSGRTGIAFGVGGKRLLRLLPDTPNAQRDPAAILLSPTSDPSLFHTFLLPVGSPVQQVINRRDSPLPTPYSPRDYDILQFTASPVARPSAPWPEIAATAERTYLERATRRVQNAGEKIISGYLNVTARVAPGDEPKMVTFVLDGITTGLLNRPPYTLRWNTSDWADGEHLIEIRALTASGQVMTQTRKLVITRNARTPVGGSNVIQKGDMP